MNYLFNTSFETLNIELGRVQTTKGIFLGYENELLILDEEGTDSRERGDNKSFENFFSSFSMLCSDIIIINMWTVDVGRDESLTEMFSIMFYSYLKLKGSHEKKKKIFIVLRDFHESFDKKFCIQTLKNDIEKAWKDVNNTYQLNN